MTVCRACKTAVNDKNLYVGYTCDYYLCDNHAANYNFCYLCKKQSDYLHNNGVCNSCNLFLDSKDDFI